MSFLRWLSRSQKPKIGEMWILDDGPWPDMAVLVVDLKDGWVRYKIGESVYRALKMRDFLCIYRPS